MTPDRSHDQADQTPLARLAADLALLLESARALGAAIAQSVDDSADAAGGTPPWSADLAERIMPLSLREVPPGTPSQRRALALQRQQQRLQREGAYLEERAQRLCREVERLRTLLRQVATQAAASQSWPHAAAEYAARVQRWKADLARQRAAIGPRRSPGKSAAGEAVPATSSSD